LRLDLQALANGHHVESISQELRVALILRGLPGAGYTVQTLLDEDAAWVEALTIAAMC
jgi:hypothetical protein